MANVPALDTSEQYMYAALLKVRPLLEQRAASTTDRTLKAHYQTLASRLRSSSMLRNRLPEDDQ